MADTTHNEVFDQLSQSFKQSSLGQSSTAVSKSLLSASHSHLTASQPAVKPDDKLLQFIRYKEWLDTVKRDQESALLASGASSTAKDQDELNARIQKLQQALLKESTTHSLKELALKRLQLSDTLLQTLFPAPVSNPSVLEQRDKFRELTGKQSELVTEVIGHQKVCQRLQEDLARVRKECQEIKKSNREAMTELLQKNEESQRQTQDSNSERQKLMQGEIDRTLSHIQIGRNILQGLIVGSGINWAEDDQLRDLVLSLGRPVQP